MPDKAARRDLPRVTIARQMPFRITPPTEVCRMQCLILCEPAVRPFRLAVLASLVSAALLGSASADTVAVPAFDGGQAVSRQAGTRVLAATEIAGVRAWLEAHRTGWHSNLATPPVAQVTISLRAASQPPAVVLSLFHRLRTQIGADRSSSRNRARVRRSCAPSRQRTRRRCSASPADA